MPLLFTVKNNKRHNPNVISALGDFLFIIYFFRMNYFVLSNKGINFASLNERLLNTLLFLIFQTYYIALIQI